MAKKKRGLGRGLSALIPDEPIKDNESDIEKVENIDINKIKPSKDQPRKDFDREAIGELAESIGKIGLIQPIIVRKSKSGYEIIAGERRFRAVKELGSKKIPAIIREEDDKKTTEIALIENIQREDLNIIEEAQAYEKIIKNNKITQDELSKSIGKSRSHITNVIRLLKLSNEVINMVKEGLLTSGHARSLLSLKDKSREYDTALLIIQKKLNVRETEKLITNLNNPKIKKKNKKEKDPFISEIEENLRRSLGTKVIINKGKNKGKIEIEYYNEDDLERIIEILDR